LNFLKGCFDSGKNSKLLKIIHFDLPNLLEIKSLNLIIKRNLNEAVKGNDPGEVYGSVRILHFIEPN